MSTFGYTLVEVLVAVTIVSIALAGLMSVLAVGSRQTSVATNKGAATHEANELLEKLRASVAANPYDLPGGPNNPTGTPNLYDPLWHAGCDPVPANVTYNANGQVTNILYAATHTIPHNPNCQHVFYDSVAGDTVATTHYLHLNAPYFSADFRSKYAGKVRYWVTDDGNTSSPSRYKVQVVIDWQEAALQAGG